VASSPPLYYPQIYQSMTIYRRTFMKDLTDEDPNEPTTQLIGAFSAGFHYGNVLLDHVGLEAVFATCRLRPSAKNHTSLIAYRLKEALPATTDLLARLSSPVTSDTVVPEGTLYATAGTLDTPEILYEVEEEYEVIRTDLPVYALEEDGGVFTDVINEINGFSPLDLWGGTMVRGDALWLGHESCLWDAIRLVLSDKGTLFGEEHFWVLEYYDGRTDDTVPSDVDLVGAELKFDLTNLLGTNDRTGTDVTVQFIIDGTEETGTSYYSGGTNYVNVGILGQSVPSEEITDYIVGARFKEVPGAILTEHTDGFQINYDLPESTSRRWQKTVVDGIEAYWLRLRVVSLPGTNESPVIDGGVGIAVGAQWLKLVITQGETHEDDPAGVFSCRRGRRWERCRRGDHRHQDRSVVRRVGLQSASCDWLGSARGVYRRESRGSEDRRAGVSAHHGEGGHGRRHAGARRGLRL